MEARRLQYFIAISERFVHVASSSVSYSSAIRDHSLIFGGTVTCLWAQFVIYKSEPKGYKPRVEGTYNLSPQMDKQIATHWSLQLLLPTKAQKRRCSSDVFRP